MDRLRSGFHRKSRKESPSRPTIITDTTTFTTTATASGRSSGKTTPEPGTPQPLQIPSVPNKKSSPLRTLRDLSRSHKRARSPAAGSDGASSPISALSARNSPIDRFMALPHPLSAVSRTNDHDNDRHHGDQGGRGGGDDNDDDDATRRRHQQQQEQEGRPKIPSFLTLSPHEIEARFQEILWLERHRLIQSVANPSPDFRWARVTGDHLRKLDRYMNIQPWQNNRVRLRVPAGKQDYINASPISLGPVAAGAGTTRQDGTGGANTPQGAGAVGTSAESERYIAMQGPKHKTTGHVWRMVVEQLESPGVIIMLTETHEANIEKCYPYFPRSPDDPPLEVGRKDEFGDGFRASVRCEAIEETEAGDAIELRRLVIRVYKRQSKKERDAAATAAAAAEAAAEAAAAATSAANGSGPVEAATTPPVESDIVDENGDVKMLSPSKISPDDEGCSAQNDDEDEDDNDNDNDNDDDTDSVTVELGRPVEGPPQSGVDTPQQQPVKDVAAPALATTDEYEERTVWHFLYKKWPDFGVPALSDLDSFFTLMRLSRERNTNPSNPRIVHCSAGVGRSGTFIALEHIMREMDAGVLEDWDARHKGPAARADHSAAEGREDDADSMEGQNGHLEDPAAAATAAAAGEEDDVDPAQKMDVEVPPPNVEDLQALETARHAGDDLIFRTVNQLREQRRNMVQADAQFHFIYQVVRKLWEERYGSAAASDNKNNNAAASSAATGAAVSNRPPRLPDLDGEPAAKRFEFDPFVEP